MITITTEAANQLKSFLIDNGSPEGGPRGFFVSRGSAGLQYGMTIEDNAEDGDEIIESDGVRLLVDNFSAMYLAGAEVDYVNSLMGGGFTVHNPNAVSGCACGHSFNAGGNAETAQGCGCGH